jgi:hypothetical protein
MLYCFKKGIKKFNEKWSNILFKLLEKMVMVQFSIDAALFMFKMQWVSVIISQMQSCFTCCYDANEQLPPYYYNRWARLLKTANVDDHTAYNFPIMKNKLLFSVRRQQTEVCRFCFPFAANKPEVAVFCKFFFRTYIF